jgi:DNA-binding ferritin-like protein (Dps family)
MSLKAGTKAYKEDKKRIKSLQEEYRKKNRQLSKYYDIKRQLT